MGTPVQAGEPELVDHVSGDRIPVTGINSTQQQAWFRQGLVNRAFPVQIAV